MSDVVHGWMDGQRSPSLISTPLGKLSPSPIYYETIDAFKVPN